MAFEADGEACELVEQGEGLLDDVAQRAKPLGPFGATGGDDRDDAAPGQVAAQPVTVVALVGKQHVRAVAGSTWPPRHRRDAIDQVAGRADVVDVPTGSDHLERDATAVADQMVLATRAAPVDRRGPNPGAPFFARRWAASATARDQSITPAVCSAASRIRWSWSKLPASVQRLSRRQQVMPEPNPNSWGRSSQPMPVCSTNRIPCRHSRSSIGRGPGDRVGQGGSNGSISSHNPSSTIHGAATPDPTANPTTGHRDQHRLTKSC